MRKPRLASILLSATLFAVAHAATAATINVTAGQNLSQILEDANEGDEILVGPGTYTAQVTPCFPIDGPATFHILRRLTVRSTHGPEATTLRSDTGGSVISAFPNNCRVRNSTEYPSGMVLEGFRLLGSVAVQSVALNLFDITLRNLIVESSGRNQGITIANVHGALIDSNVVTSMDGPGIETGNGSRNGHVINNRVRTTGAGHAMMIDRSARMTVAGNTITGSGADGIALVGTTLSRVERNNIGGHRYDGVRVTNTPKTGLPPGLATHPADWGAGTSSWNFIGHNVVTSNGWARGIETSGHGIDLLGNANGNLVFGNDLHGAPEYGIALSASSSNHVQANQVHGNYRGGVLVANDTSVSGGIGGRPADNLVRHNQVYYNPNHGMVNLRDTLRTDIAFNFLSGAPHWVADNPTNAPGGAPFTASYTGISTGDSPAQQTAIYGNLFITLDNSIYLDDGVSGASVYRNRFANAMNQYAIAPAGVAWDAGPVLGGNWWGFTRNADARPNGNPSDGSTPFTDIFCPATSGCAYADRYPFASPTFARPYSIAFDLPRFALPIYAAGSRKTLAWRSTGCTYAYLVLINGRGRSEPIGLVPDAGYHVVTLPSIPDSGALYLVRALCVDENGNGVPEANAESAQFFISPMGLTLLSPGPFSRATAGDTMTVSWSRAPGVTGPVEVFLRDGNFLETRVASGVMGNAVAVPVPSIASNRMSVRIATGAAREFQDATDGWFSIAHPTSFGFTPGFAPLQKLAMGDTVKLEWTSPPSSRYVDIEIHDGTTYVPIAQNLPDFGSHEWMATPAFAGSRTFRITYKNSLTQAAPALGQRSSQALDINNGITYSVTQSPWPAPASVGKDVVYRIDVTHTGSVIASNVSFVDNLPAGSTFVWTSPPCAQESPAAVRCNVGTLTPGGTFSFKVVVRPGSPGIATNTVTTGSSNHPYDVSVNPTPAGVPIQRYRLYSDATKEHHFTTDLNEYTVLGGNGNWVQEGPAGKLLDNPGSYNGVAAVPFYRLYDNGTRFHHWTSDANEYYTLWHFFGPWTAEGADGYILPTAATGTTQLFRLFYPFVTGLHHWTLDANENSALTATYGWIGETSPGFVIQ